MKRAPDRTTLLGFCVIATLGILANFVESPAAPDVVGLLGFASMGWVARGVFN